MKTTSAVFAISILVIALAIPVDAPLSACSCIEPTTDSAYARAAAVFAGRAISVVRYFDISDTVTQSGSYYFLATFRVQTSWKGDLDSTVQVHTIASSPSCGYPFAKDFTYIVFAFEYKNRFETGYCTGTAGLSQAAKTVQYLDNHYRRQRG